MNDYKELITDIEHLVKERDAAVTAINTIRYAFIEHDSNAGCCGCKNNTFDYDKSVCAGCTLNDNWEWRGVQEGNSESSELYRVVVSNISHERAYSLLNKLTSNGFPGAMVIKEKEDNDVTLD